MTTVQQYRRTKARGVVKSAAMVKTITVMAERLMKHPRYQKYVRRREVFKVHDEKREAGVGDVVDIVATRPMSKTKNWRLARIVKRAQEGRS
jgi:small subunit ribosomal protein S17